MRENAGVRSTFTIDIASSFEAKVAVDNGEFMEHARLGKVWIAGRLFGGIRHGRKTSRAEMVTWLGNCRSLDEIREAASCGFGPFYVILLTEDRLHVLSSAASCGVYYTPGPEPRFSDNELSLFEHHAPPVPGTAETLRYVVDNLNLSPHRGLFEGVRRSPGATVLSYDLRSGAVASLVLMPDEGEPKGPAFDCLVDCCAEALADEFRRHDLFPVVYWSGGIDGLVWVIALAKAGAPVTIVHGIDPRSSDLFPPLCRAALERLPSTAAVRVIVADRSDGHEADAEATMLSGLVKSNYLRPDYRLKFADLALARNHADAANAVVIMGFGIDGLYSFKKGGESLSSTNGGRVSFYYSSLGQYGKYLGITLRLKDAMVNAWCSNRGAKERLSFGLFCDATADTRYLASKSACPELKKLFMAELLERFQYITRVVTGFAGCMFGATERPLNASLKLAGYYNNDSVHAVRFRDQGRFTASAYELPYLYTPMVRFFSGRSLTLRDIVMPKSLLHDYVKANLGTSYNDLLQRARKESRTSGQTAAAKTGNDPHDAVESRDERYLAKLRAVYSRHREYWRDFTGVPGSLATFLKRLDDDLMRQPRRAKPPGRCLENFVHLTAWLNMNVGRTVVEERLS